MRKIHTPNHKLYEQYYLNQAKQMGGNLPAFHGARSQRGYGLRSVFKGLFRWATPHLKQGAKGLGKKALQTGVNVAQDMLAEENVKTATSKRVKQVLGDIPSQNSSQSGAGRKARKRKAQPIKNSSPPGKKQRTSLQKKKPEEKFYFLN